MSLPVQGELAPVDQVNGPRERPQAGLASSEAVRTPDRPDFIPLCMECGEQPAKRHYGKVGLISKDFGPVRKWRGRNYRWFCSNTCSGRYRGNSSDMRARVVAASKFNVARAEKRVLDRLVMACKDLMDEHGKVEAKAMVRVLMKEIRRERTNSATRRWIRRKRDLGTYGWDRKGDAA